MGVISEIAAKIKVWGFAGIKDFAARKLHWRRLRRELQASARAACPPPVRGITLIGDLMHNASLSTTNRDFVRALKAAGIPFQTFPTDRVRRVPECDFADILTPRAEFRLCKYSHVVEMFASPLPAGLVPNRARIAFWEGEHGVLDVFPFLDCGDTVIAMSDFNAEYFKREFRSPVRKILFPLRMPDFAMVPRDEIRAKCGIGKDDFAVLFIFDLGSFARKNPGAAMRAFAQAFPRETGVKLVFKTMGAKTHPAKAAELERLAAELGLSGRFVAIHEYLPQSELYSLAAACDVYISLHRGEGFGIGMAEAMLMGKPVVATAWSANTEFCRPGVSLPVPYKLVPVKPGEYFVSMEEWAEADVPAAADALRRLYLDRAFAAETGAKAKAFIENHFSTAAFAKTVESFLGRDSGNLEV